MNLEPMQKAAVLIEALPYIQRFNRRSWLSSTAAAPCWMKNEEKGDPDVVL